MKTNLKKSLLVVKVGTDSRPASPEDLESVEEVMKESNLLQGVDALVTHHAFKTQLLNKKKLENSLLLAVVGTKNYPPSKEDLENAEQGIKDTGVIPDTCTVKAVPFGYNYKSIPAVKAIQDFVDTFETEDDVDSIDLRSHYLEFKKILGEL